MAPLYGQVVVGPPGSGKSTYCDGMQQYLRLLGRDAWVVNLDPANDGTRTGNGTETSTGATSESKLPYETIYDVCEEAVRLESVMEETGLGPNGALIYCMEYVEMHIDGILARLKERLKPQTYLLFDFPGQVELYTHSTCVQTILNRASQTLDLRLTAVQLIDAHHCTDATKFISAALLGTTTMIRLELPTVSVLSKIDLLSRYGELPMQIEYFTECRDLDRLVQYLDNPMLDEADPFSVEEDFSYVEDLDYEKARRKRRQSRFFQRYEKLHRSLAEVVEDYGLLSFVPLDITNAESVGRVLARVDKCNGYSFLGGSINQNLFQCAVQTDDMYEALSDVRERLGGSASIGELQK